MFIQGNLVWKLAVVSNTSLQWINGLLYEIILSSQILAFNSIFVRHALEQCNTVDFTGEKCLQMCRANFHVNKRSTAARQNEYACSTEWATDYWIVGTTKFPRSVQPPLF